MRGRTQGLLLVIGALTASLATSACSDRDQAEADLRRFVQGSTQRDLVAFESEGALKDYLKELSEAQRRVQEAQQDSWSGDSDADGIAAESSAEPSAPPADSPAEPSEEGEGASAGGESITNTQEAGIDEGGIIKAHGDHLVVLRRGRLFSVKLGGGALEPVSMVDVFPKDGAPSGWYDEMLIAGDRIVVVGYSYGAGATEIGLFNIDGEGRISWQETYYLRSNDYYSSRNYASRLIGDTLIFYMPYGMFTWGYEGDQYVMQPTVPGLKAYKVGQEGSAGWSDIVKAEEVYQPIQPTDYPILHTVVTCDLGEPELECEARGIIGPWARNFYVASDAVYVWVQGGYSAPEDGVKQEIAQTPAAVYRLPLGDEKPGALRVWGAPTDQFSFKASDDGFLNVLVRAEGGGDWMWSPEGTAGDVALLRVPTAAFKDGVQTVKREAYVDLPRPERGWEFQNRFVGDYVLYGTGSSWGYAAETERDDRVFAYPWRQGGKAQIVPLKHGVDRIEVMGRDAVVIGSDNANLHFSAVALGDGPRLAGSYAQPGAAQGETRSHGFFFKPQGEDRGVLGLPIREGNDPGYAQLYETSASVLYLNVEHHTFTELGKLGAQANRVIDDRCVASCVDWYGNARPVFYKGRVFALLGYELVEGKIDGGTIREIARVDVIEKLGVARRAE